MFAAAGVVVVAGGLYAWRNRNLAANKILMAKELQSLRTARLEKQKQTFRAAKYDLAPLQAELSTAAQVAVVAECDHLPDVYRKKRFYEKRDNAASPGDDQLGDYAQWIDRVWNKDVVAFPHIIVRVSCPKDVAACFKFAQGQSLKISVAGGCHSASAFADGAFTIDMAEMNNVEYKEGSQECWVQAGAVLAQVDAACSANGRLVPVGTNGDTGVAGLTLSGGTGFLVRKYGFTIDHLVGVDVVLPDGTFLENIRDSSPPEQREILWGCRGGGGHFGIVTKFYFNTRPIPNGNKFLLGEVVALCPTQNMKRDIIINWWKQVEKMGDDTVSILTLPAAPVVPLTHVHYGAQATEDLAKRKNGFTQIADLAQAANLGGVANVQNSWKIIDYKKVQTLVAEHQGHGYIYQTMVQLLELNESVAACMAESIAKAPKNTVLLAFPNGGESDRADKESTKCSLSTRHAKLWILVEARWDPEVDGPVAGRAKAVGWCKDFVATINAKNPGAMAKTTHAFSDARDENAGEGNNVLADATNAEVAERLRVLKQRVDPLNVLSHNRKLSTKTVTLS